MWKLRTTLVNVTDLCRQVVLQNAHCADRNLFLFLDQPVLPFQSVQCQQHWSQTAKSWCWGKGSASGSHGEMEGPLLKILSFCPGVMTFRCRIWELRSCFERKNANNPLFQSSSVQSNS